MVASAVLSLLLAVASDFSHQAHASLGCQRCHAGMGAKKGFPKAATCAACHGAAQAVPRRWSRVQELAAFARFSHARHQRTPCAHCHGNVEATTRLTAAVPFTMKFCRSCHLREKARASCDTCHEAK
jgi:DnaJ-class molecular chaperone